mgnify:CR=1 FL=1|jgi:hypothetical protein
MLNNLDRLLCKISEYHPHWARALLVLAPRAGNETRLTAEGVVIDAQGINNDHQRQALIPVVHAVLDHAADRATLEARGFGKEALAGFDRVADHLAQRAVARGLRLSAHTTLSSGSVHISQEIDTRVEGARTLRGLVRAAYDICHSLGATKLAELGREFPAPDLSEGFAPEAGIHDPQILRSFSRETDIPFEGAAPAELAEATLSYDAFLAATTTETRLVEIDRLVEAACAHLEDATRAPNGPAWATLLMEIALGHALDLGLAAEICNMPSYIRYSDLRKQARLSTF